MTLWNISITFLFIFYDIIIAFFYDIIKTCCFFFWEKKQPASPSKVIDTFRQSSVRFETPACNHSNDRYLTFKPINVMCHRCILSSPNLSFILVTKTPMNGNNSQPTKLSSASLRLRFSLTRKVKESPAHEMVLSTQALHTMTLVCSVSLLLSLND